MSVLFFYHISFL
jgi:hypothetical protein